MQPKKVTTASIRDSKREDKKLAVLTAYDFTFARLVDEIVDIVLVGDSLGMVIQGESNTLSVTLEDMIYHSKAVARGLRHAHLVVDMPFMTYQSSTELALQNAGRLLAEGKAESVKVEGGVNIAETVEKMVRMGIPVMGHVGLTPQSVHAFGGYKIQGRTDAAREAILQDALAFDKAGAFAVVLEGIPADLAHNITERLSIPTIGIGAGPYCNGQVLVNQDLLGMNPEFQPRFVKNYANLADGIRAAVQTFSSEVKSGHFPEEKHSF